MEQEKKESSHSPPSTYYTPPSNLLPSPQSSPELWFTPRPSPELVPAPIPTVNPWFPHQDKAPQPSPHGAHDTAKEKRSLVANSAPEDVEHKLRENVTDFVAGVPGLGRGNVGMNAFSMQQPTPANRGAALNTTNLTSSKLGTGTSWGYNAAGGTSGDPGVRAGNVTTRTQPPRPQDTSQYPPLGATANQQQNPSSAIWANRPTQQTPVQRQQHPTPSQSISSTTSQPLHPQSQGNQRDPFSNPNQFSRNLDDYRHGGQGIAGQLLGDRPTQSGNQDDFSSLGEPDSGEAGPERRSSIMQHNAYGLLNSGVGMTQQAGLRNPLANPGSGLSENGRITSPNASVSGASRSPLPQDQNGIIGQDRFATNGSTSDGIGVASMHSSNRTIRPDDYARQHSSSFQQDSLGSNVSDSPETFASRLSRMTPWQDMSPIDKWGLPGLLAQMHTISKDQSDLARGQDLTQLGLDLNSNEPLHPTFATPFSAPTHARPLEADYHIPQCYSVANVKPIQERWGSFTDDTLIWIFYNVPRDILQVEAADELYKRKWRWNMREHLWITKDEMSGPPMVSADGLSERGRYWIWDPAVWKKYRREMIIVYTDLHQNGSRSNDVGGGGLNGDRPTGGPGFGTNGANGGAGFAGI